MRTSSTPVDLLYKYGKVYHFEMGGRGMITEVPKKVMDLMRHLGYICSLKRFEVKVIIFSSNDSYWFEVVGTEEGNYGLDIGYVEKGKGLDFSIRNVLVKTNTTHEYNVNWTNLAQGEAGVTLKIDDNGDGEFEENITIQPPIANFTYAPQNPVINQTITFDASNSYDDGNITSYKWNFGDETNGTGDTTSHSYSSAGNYGRVPLSST
jgi:PKD repeat protein